MIYFIINDTFYHFSSHFTPFIVNNCFKFSSSFEVCDTVCIKWRCKELEMANNMRAFKKLPVDTYVCFIRMRGNRKGLHSQRVNENSKENSFFQVCNTAAFKNMHGKTCEPLRVVKSEDFLQTRLGRN